MMFRKPDLIRSIIDRVVNHIKREGNHFMAVEVGSFAAFHGHGFVNRVKDAIPNHFGITRRNILVTQFM